MSPGAIPEAVRAAIRIVETRRLLFGGDQPMTETSIARVVAVFQANAADWVLVGAHAVGFLTEPRATADFDFIVDGRKLSKILADLTTELGDLRQREIGGAIELAAIGVDLINSANHPLFSEALRDPRLVGEWRVPRTEVLIALKFLASISPWRNRTKKALDIVDLRAIYLAEAPNLDREEVIQLGGLAYPDAEREMRDLLDRIDRGDPLSI